MGLGRFEYVEPASIWDASRFVRHFLAGNVCRCGGHMKILAAVLLLPGQSQQPEAA